MKKGIDLGRVEVAELLKPNPVKPDAASEYETSVKNEDIINSHNQHHHIQG